MIKKHWSARASRRRPAARVRIAVRARLGRGSRRYPHEVCATEARRGRRSRMRSFSDCEGSRLELSAPPRRRTSSKAPSTSESRDHAAGRRVTIRAVEPTKALGRLEAQVASSRLAGVWVVKPRRLAAATPAGKDRMSARRDLEKRRGVRATGPERRAATGMKQREPMRPGAVPLLVPLEGQGRTLVASHWCRVQMPAQPRAGSQRSRVALPERAAAMTGARKARSARTTASNS